MRLWIAKRTDEVDYDEDDAVIIRAKSQMEADLILMTGYYGGACPGFTTGNHTVAPLPARGEAGIILRSFNAG
jgi:hypothetical protein